MSRALKFDAEWEILQSGSPEERACFAQIGIQYGDRWLTEVDDRLVKRTRTAPALSGYLLAQWLAFNWWRLRWEPRKTGVDWACAHRMSAIGGGYVWPNITITSDGQRILLNAKPTEQNPREPQRYIADLAAMVRAGDFESAVDDFLAQVLDQLRSEGLPDTNLKRIWDAVSEERGSSEATLWRRLEASLGFDPDQGDQAEIERLVADAKALGQDGVAELAASGVSASLSCNALNEAAGRLGASCNLSSAVRLGVDVMRSLPRIGHEPAWRRAAAAAKALRAQEKLGQEPISDQKLAEMAGVSEKIWTSGGEKFSISFMLDVSAGDGRVVLRAPRQTGRRFDLARLLGDRVAGGVNEELRPATEAATYRQQLQKTFATEFLCPFDVVDAMAAGDYSTDRTEEIAEHFNVSPLTIRAALANHGRIPRDDVELGAAA